MILIIEGNGEPLKKVNHVLEKVFENIKESIVYSN